MVSNHEYLYNFGLQLPYSYALCECLNLGVTVQQLWVSWDWELLNLMKCKSRDCSTLKEYRKESCISHFERKKALTKVEEMNWQSWLDEEQYIQKWINAELAATWGDVNFHKSTVWSKASYNFPNHLGNNNGSKTADANVKTNDKKGRLMEQRKYFQHSQ